MNIDSVNINTIDEVWGTTPLHDAIEKKNFNEIERLLKAGADPNIADELDHLPLNYGGSYPLHYAVDTGLVEIVQLLLQYRANPQLPNRDAELPIDIAYNRKLYRTDKDSYDRIIEVLKHE